MCQVGAAGAPIALTVATQVSSGSSSTSASTGLDRVVAVAPISSPWCSHPPPPQASTPPPSTAFRASSPVSSRIVVLLVLDGTPQPGGAGRAAREIVAGLPVCADGDTGGLHPAGVPPSPAVDGDQVGAGRGEQHRVEQGPVADAV